MQLKSLVPKEFLCHYPLKTGALFVGIFMCCITVATGIVLIVQVSKMDADSCPSYVWRAAYSYNITAIIYNTVIFLTNLMLTYAVLKGKLYFVLVWIIITDVWLVQTILLLIVLLCLYSLEVKLAAWIMCVIFGFLAIGILIYLSMVVLGYWLQEKQRKSCTSEIQETPVPNPS